MIGNRLREIRAAAMHRDDNVRVQLLDLADHLLDVILRCRTKMEAADQRMDLLHAGDFLRLQHRVDDARVAARGDDVLGSMRVLRRVAGDAGDAVG